MKNILCVNLGKVEQVPVGQGRCFIIDRQEVAVFRTRDNRLFAIENKCPHRGGPLSEGIVGDGIVLCPLHGHKFDLQTGAGKEGHECVRPFKIFQENNEIIIECPAG